jgi:virginiamycin B lyase
MLKGTAVRMVLLSAFVTSGNVVEATALTVKGHTRSSERQAISGVFVTARDTVRGVAVSVVSDSDGRFVIDCHTAHSLTAHRVGFTTVSRSIAADVREYDIVLERSTDIIGVVPASVLARVFPDGTEKRRLIVDCMGCHQFNQPIVFDKKGVPLDPAAWRSSTEKMIGFCGPKTSFPILPPDRLPKPTAHWIARYLTSERLQEHVAAPAPIERRAAKAIVTEYDLPRPEGLPVPDLPHDLMLDQEGRVLITGMFSGMIYRLDPRGGTFEQHQIPLEFANPRALDIDRSGNWWIVLGAPMKIARYTLTNEAWDFFDIGMYPHSVMVDESGRVWFNGHFTDDPELLGYLDADRDTTHVYVVPPDGRPDEQGGTIPYGLRVAPDGTVWGTELVGNRLVRFDASTEEVRVYEMPSPHSGPRRLDIARDGTVWIPEYAADKLARFDPKTETFTEYDFPTANGLPYCARIDHRRNRVWISQPGNDGIASFDIATEEFVEYRLPTHIAFIRHLDIDLETGVVWGAYSQSPGVHPKIVRLNPNDD